MKKKINSTYNGIVICDSITMSVKKKRPDLRRLEAAVIAIVGFVAVIMSFLEMFSFKYTKSTVLYAAIITSVVYIAIAFTGKKAMWIAGASFIALAVAAYKFFRPISRGFKYVYNVIYCDSMKTTIKYYKYLDYEDEKLCITLFFVFCIWLLALVIYTFTINRPNPLVVLLVTFPIIEVGLYNGIDIPIFWGILTVAYWLALLAISTIDLGEFYGGKGGFVRKDNLFFPKRQMRLKVTEKCAVIIMTSAAAVTLISLAVMKLSGYERSEKLNEKRMAVKDAVNSFSVDDLSDSIYSLSEAFGFKIDYESHKLGNKDRLKYKNVTDIIVTFDRWYDGAVYIKGYAGAHYGDNEWESLDEDSYKNAADLFDSFKEYEIYPQDFPYAFVSAAYGDDKANDTMLWIEAKRKKTKSFAPYATNNFNDMKYSLDNTVSSKKSNSNEYAYKFYNHNFWYSDYALNLDDEYEVFYPERIEDDKWREEIVEYCEDNNRIDGSGAVGLSCFPINADTLCNNGETAMACLLELEYRQFVYDNYLQVPSNKSMNEVKAVFSDVIEQGKNAVTAEEKREFLNALREKINTMAVYSLSPGKTPSNRDFVNYFLLENHKGYCTHFATSGVMLARMAGIPARYATGYIVVGDDFNDSNKNEDGTYTIDVRDSRSHAWAEVYIDGYGWVPFEFTSGYSESTINTEPSVTTTTITDISGESGTTTTVTAKPRPQQSQKTENSTTQSAVADATTTTVTKKAAGASGNGNGVGVGGKNNKSGAGVVTVLIVAAAVAIVWLRRYLILSIRRKRFTSGSEKKRMGYIYSYSEKLLGQLKIKKGTMSYADYADFVEQRLVPEYFANGAFRNFVDSALKSRFADERIQSEIVKSSIGFTEALSRKIYEKSGVFRKIYLKIIIVLV